MTENEAIEYIKNMAFMCEKHEKCEYGNQCTTKCLKATKMAIKSLEEIQQYRAIGTIEEFKDLKEKSTPYKPQEYEDRYYACKCDNILLPKWRKYPTELMPKSEGLPHCMACGQKLDWQ